MFDDLIYSLLIILAAGLVAGLVCRWLKISVLVGYLIVGAVIGRNSLGWIADKEYEIEALAEVGVFLLLFSIGLEFSLTELWRLRRHLLIGGSVQMLLVAIPVAAVLVSLDLDWSVAVLLAAAAAFSSTVLVFKALSEGGHLNLPHGRRAISILLFQDILLIPLLLAVPLLVGSDETAGIRDFLWLGLASAVFVAAMIVARMILSRWIIPLFARLRSLELIVLFTLVSLAAVTLAAHKLGLPAAIGALAAGLIFSDSRWTHQIDALVLPLRETFSAIFFVSLGLLLDPQLFGSHPLVLLGGLAGIIMLKATAATVALRLTGLDWRAAGGTGLGLAHIGEFAFVLVLLGRTEGLLSDDIYTQFITLAVGSLVLTPVLLNWGFRQAAAQPFDEPQSLADHSIPAGKRAIVVGAGLIGRRVTTFLDTTGYDVYLIDRAPINLHPFAQEGFHTIAGDATDGEIVDLAGGDTASLLAVCIPDDLAAVRIVRHLRSRNETCFILVRCRFQTNVNKLTDAGANQVVSEEAQASVELLRVLKFLETAEDENG